MERDGSTPPDRTQGVSDVLLRHVRRDDLPVFFEHQLDATAKRMAAFTAQDPTDRTAFMAK